MVLQRIKPIVPEPNSYASRATVLNRFKSHVNDHQRSAKRSFCKYNFLIEYHKFLFHILQIKDFRCTVLPNSVSLIAKLVVLTTPTANIYGNDGRDITNSSLTVHQGEHVEIECKGAGRPEPTVKWFADGARVGNTHGVHVSDGVMLIDSADHHHVRTYQCLTDNGVSVGHASINIIVQRKFQFSVQRIFGIK